MLERDAVESDRADSVPAGFSRDGVRTPDREIQREILDVLVERSALSVLDIATTVDRHPITVDLTCARLDEQGYIYPHGRGRYAITELGTRQFGESPDS